MLRLQFSSSQERSSALIRKICHSPFSHVDVLLKDGGLLGASNSPKAPYTLGNPGGVAIRTTDYQPFKIRRLATLNATPEIEAKFFQLLGTQMGKPFDETALQAFLDDREDSTRDWREADMWFCSELVTWALEQAGFFPYKLLVSKDRVSPADLLLMLNPYVDADIFWEPIPGLALGPGEG